MPDATVPNDPVERARKHLAAIVESSDDAIVSKDLNGIVQTWNPGAERIFGYTASEIVGQSITIIIPPERLSEEHEVLSRIRRGESVTHYETIRRRKDGTLIPISLTVSPIRADSGQIIGASKIARDVSDRKKAEAALARAMAEQLKLHRRLSGLVTAANRLLRNPSLDVVLPATVDLARELIECDGVAIWRFVEATGTWRPVASNGLSDAFAREMPEGLEHSTVSFAEPMVIPDASAHPLAQRRRRAYKREGIVSVVVAPISIRGLASATLAFYSRSRREFSEVEVETARALASVAGGAITTAELHDEQRRARDRATFLAHVGGTLAATLDSRKTLIDIANLAVPHIADWCTVDLLSPTGTLQRLAVTHADPAKVDAASALQEKYPPDPASPYGVHEVVRTGRPILMSDVPAGVLATVQDEGHLQAIRKLGLTSYMCVPLVAHGRTVGAITFVSAESGRQYGAEDLRFAEDVAARAALAVDNSRAYEEAQQANRLKDEFLATLSHELRTPLNAILGYARMLRLSALPPDRQQHAVEVVERNAASLAQMVEDVLDVSRIISGKIRLNVRPVQVAAVIEHAVATIAPAADAKGVRLQTVIDRGAGLVSGDADRLQQVVWNLLSNAVKFTPRGGRVQVRLEPVESRIEIIVADTGRGIPEEFLPHVFERFRQADAGFAREHGGLGLGLAITRHIVEAHGGTIHVASAGEGQGATFRVKLPVTIAHPEPAERRTHPRVDVDPPEGPPLVLTGVRILAVDDDRDSRELLKAILDSAGAVVTTASSAPQALELLHANAYDVLVADIGMPHMDGLTLIRSVRQSPDSTVKHIAAAALTAYARSEDRMKTLNAGFQMHLAKPVNPAELVTALAALARQGRSSPS